VLKKGYIIDNNGFEYSRISDKFDNLLNDPPYHIDLSGALLNNLSKDEAIHIFCYTGSSGTWINNIIKNRTLRSNSNAIMFVELLDKALSKILPTTEKYLYHNAQREPLDLINSFTISNYLSTSKDDYNNDNELIVWRITPKRNSLGRDISNITGNNTEKEVLFCRESRFKFINSYKEGHTLYYNLIEV